MDPGGEIVNIGTIQWIIASNISSFLEFRLICFFNNLAMAPKFC